MQRIANIHEAKTHLSSLIANMGGGDEIILCRHNRPVARIVPLASSEPAEPRPWGMARNVVVPADFNAPLPDDLVGLFTGQA